MDRVQPANLDEMDLWLAALANDTAPAKSPLEKIVRNRPAAVTDVCYTKEGQRITDIRRCAELFPVYSNPRLNAGQPLSATLLNCELKPVDALQGKIDQRAARRHQNRISVRCVRLLEERRCGPRVRHVAVVSGSARSLDDGRGRADWWRRFQSTT